MVRAGRRLPAITTLQILDGTILNADISTSADIDVSKLADSGTAGDIILSKTGGTTGWVSVSGDVGINGSGAVTIGNNKVLTANINTGAVTGTKTSSANKTHAITRDVGNINATKSEMVFVSTKGTRNITGIHLISDTATSTSDATNNYVFDLINVTQANAVVGTATTNGNELSANTKYSLTIDTAEDDITANDVYIIQITKNGSPTVLSSANIILVLEYEAVD